MHLYEFIVIYFAAGSPLAVLRLTRGYRGVLVHDIVSFLFELVFWLPLAAYRGLVLAFRRPPVLGPSATFSEEPEHITQLRRLLDSLSGHIDDRGLRSDLERFLSLYDESILAEATPAGEPFELFAAAGNSGGVVSSACLARRNQRRIMEHRDRAWSDLLRTLKHSEIVTEAALNDGPPGRPSSIPEFAFIGEPALSKPSKQRSGSTRDFA